MFPSGFFIGAATAGHQVEGNNTNSDSWALEHMAGSVLRQPSGDGADFYHRWSEDIETAAALGLRAFRFSLEWSRIEPEEGWFSRATLDHYRRIAAACQDAGLVTIVTFNHWTTPRWFASDGGWENPASITRFARFTAEAAAGLGGEVDWAITLNEPNLKSVLEQDARALAITRPSLPENFRPMMLWEGDQLARYSAAHRAARREIKASMDVPVGWSLACEDYQALAGGEETAVLIRRRALDEWLDVSREDDFVGVQNYTRRLVGRDGIQPPPPGSRVNDLGWELYPPSLVNAVRHAAASTQRPVVVTEHGVATWNDSVRASHTRDSLKPLAQAVAEDVDVRGYLHWTLLDEFEWFAGYDVTFGLVSVDRETFERAAKPSAHWLGRVASQGADLDTPVPHVPLVQEDRGAFDRSSTGTASNSD